MNNATEMKQTKNEHKVPDVEILSQIIITLNKMNGKSDFVLIRIVKTEYDKIKPGFRGSLIRFFENNDRFVVLRKRSGMSEVKEVLSSKKIVARSTSENKASSDDLRKPKNPRISQSKNTSPSQQKVGRAQMRKVEEKRESLSELKIKFKRDKKMVSMKNIPLDVNNEKLLEAISKKRREVELEPKKIVLLFKNHKILQYGKSLDLRTYLKNMKHDLSQPCLVTAVMKVSDEEKLMKITLWVGLKGDKKFKLRNISLRIGNDHLLEIVAKRLMSTIGGQIYEKDLRLDFSSEYPFLKNPILEYDKNRSDLPLIHNEVQFKLKHNVQVLTATIIKKEVDLRNSNEPIKEAEREIKEMRERMRKFQIREKKLLEESMKKDEIIAKLISQVESEKTMANIIHRFQITDPIKVDQNDEIGKGGEGIVYGCDFVKYHVVKEIDQEKISESKCENMDVYIKNVMDLSMIKLVHPNIIRVEGFHVKNDYDQYGDEIKRLYVVMERMDADLHKYLFNDISSLKLFRKNITLDFTHKMHIMKEIAEGVCFLHTRSHPICHRDIKPGNILISNDGKKVKICDFGLVSRLNNEVEKESEKLMKRIQIESIRNEKKGEYYGKKAMKYLKKEEESEGEEEEMCSDFQLSGTEGYRAPETKHSGYSLKGDIYSLGIVFWEILFETEIEQNKDDFVDKLKNSTFPVFIKELILTMVRESRFERCDIQFVVSRLRKNWFGDSEEAMNNRINCGGKEFLKRDLGTCKVCYEFVPEDPEELQVKEGEILTILQDDGDWLKCRNGNGVEGFIPSNFVEKQ